MLSSFEVKQFRGFSHLRIERLASVNLIIGRNNVGKTNLLEALRLYALGGHPMALTELFADREEFKPPAADRTLFNIDSLFNQAAEHIPHNHGRVEMGPVGDVKNTLTIRKSRLRLKPGTNGTEEVPSSSVPQLPETEPYVASNAVPTLAFSMGSSGSTHVYYSGLQQEWGPQPGIFLPALPPFLPARGLTSRDLARWWDRVSLRPAEKRVKECLGLITPLEGISFLESPSQPGDRIAMVGLPNLPQPVPLKSLGDGMLKMLQISLGLEYANLGPENRGLEPIIRKFKQNLKILLVDEIENGIHYTVHADLWRFIIRVSQMLGVQVFATSHSWDSILGLREAVRDIPDASVMVIRLEKKPQYTKAVLFDGSELDDVASDNIEVR